MQSTNAARFREQIRWAGCRVKRGDSLFFRDWRSCRSRKPYRNAFGCNALQRRTVDIVAHNSVDLKVEIDDCIGVIFLRLANQCLDGC
jgi:hypothetical protein